MRDVESEVEILELQLANLDSRREIADLTTLSGALDRVTACVASGSVNGAIASCANAVAQIAISFRLRDITREMIGRDEFAAVTASLDRLRDHADTLNQIADQISLLVNRLNGGLSRFHAARASARRAVATATFMGSDAAGRSIPLNTVLMNRYEVRRARYAEARRDAIRLAHIARRALEQRLGSDLADLHGLSLVDDPAGWVGLLCESTGVDYSRLRDSTGLEYETGEFMCVGDYVRRLDLVFEAYRFAYPFSSSTDTAVVSLRDDVRAVRAECDTASLNLLSSSGDVRRPAWFTDTEGCVPVPDGMGGERISSCVVARTIDPGPSPGFITGGGYGSASAFRVVFGGGATGATTDPPVSFTPESRLVQAVPLGDGGTYLLSWYGRDGVDVMGARNARDAVVLVATDGTPLPSSAVLVEVSDEPSEWNRYFRFYDVPTSLEVRVEIRPQAPFDPIAEQFVDLAAFQLEDADGLFTTPVTMITQATLDADESGVYRPRGFVGTGDEALVSRPVCEDTTGARFREGWRFGCDRVCSAGFDRGCTDEDTTEQCYREMEFTITQDAIERGQILDRSGFAYGNFNYRTEAIALNFVGTGSRSCEDDRFPSTCYSSGYIPYSLYHLGQGGGYAVRNHAGNTYYAQLFDGRIEHARGLAAERFITNPVSSADRALTEPYIRRELRGRPLPGRYVLRVWEGPGVNFEGIEDIQVLLDYRYWTRLD